MKKLKKSKKNKFNLIEEYKKCFKYLNESKKFILFIILFFSLFVLIGFLIPVSQDISNQLLSLLKKILGQTENLSQLELIKFIMFNNIKNTFFGLVFGVFLGIFPLISTLLNGYLLGFVFLLSVEQSGFSPFLNFLAYGIFELPAIFISLGLGLKLGTFIFNKKKIITFKNYLLSSLKVFLLIVVPLLVIAGIIEGTLIALSR